MSIEIEIENNVLDLLNKSLEIVPFYYSYPQEFNVIPATIYLDTKTNKITKRPKVGKWRKYQTEKYPREKLRGKKHLCVVCGKISNNLIVIDFDIPKGKYATDQETNEIYNRIKKRHPKLEECTYIVRTMRGGLHFYFFLESIDVYKKLGEQGYNIKAQKTGLKTDIKGISEIDLRCEGNIVLTYPSKYKNKKYSLWLTKETFRPLKINDKQFLEILKSITITTATKIKKETKLTIGNITPIKKEKSPELFDVLLQCHKDVLSHKIDIAEYCNPKKGGTGIDEFHYWKDLFWHVWIKLKISHESLYPYLKYQSHFNKETIKTQVKYDYHNYKLPLKTKKNPDGLFIKKSTKELYPEYTKKKKKSKKKKAKDETISNYELRDMIISQNSKDKTNIITIRENDEICRRSNGVYIRKQKSFVDTQISELLEQFEIPYLPYKKQAIIDLIKTQTYHSVKEFDTNPELLNVKNGVLNLKNGKFQEHNTSDLSFIQIPVKYNPNAECPKIDKFLNEIFNKKDIPFILEFIGLCLTSEMRFQKALMLYGNGNNGKTTFLNLLVNLIGVINKSSVALSQLNKPFEGAKLEVKLVNIVSDLDSSKMTIRFFKLYVGNEWSITINRKFKEPYDIKPTAKLLYSCNAIFPEIPKDTDKGFFRKWILIECPYEFDERENLKMLDSLLTEKELSGFLNKAIEGFYRLLKRGKFDTKYTNWFDVRKIWTDKANPLNSFIESEALETGKYIDAIHDINNQFWETKRYTLKIYNEYLEEKLNVPPIQQSLLTRIITNHPKFSLAKRSIKGIQKEVYIGFKLREKRMSYKRL